MNRRERDNKGMKPTRRSARLMCEKMSMEMLNKDKNAVVHGAGVAEAGNYASVNGLNMYDEIHGTGMPLVLLHGGLTTIDSSLKRFCRPWRRPGRSSPSSSRDTGTRPTSIAR
jgi:hypothetical protein